MKPPPFAYHAPRSVDEALDVLADTGEDGKVLAGGQSLIPLLNMRLAAPSALVDINRLDELDTVDVDDHGVRVGARVRHARLEHDDQAERACPLLRQALRLVAHPVIRNRGTVCGSVAHADPAGELTAVLAVLGGTVHVASRDGGREVPADAFFVGPLEADLRPGDLVTAVSFPRLADSAGSAFLELARRHGDYAMCGVAAVVDLDAEGAVAAARAGYVSVGPTPLVVDLTGQLSGSAPDAADWHAAGEHAAAQADPEPDLHATADYRRHLMRVLAARALQAAADHASVRGNGGGAGQAAA